MKLFGITAFMLSAAVWVAAEEACAREILISRSSLLVDRYEVGGDGRWKFKGRFIDGTKSGHKPVSVAAAPGRAG